MAMVSYPGLRRWCSYVGPVMVLALALTMLFTPFHHSLSAQSTGPDERLAMQMHSQQNLIGVSDGYVLGTYTPEFELVDQLTLIADPDVIPIGLNFDWSPDGTKLSFSLFGYGLETGSSVLQIWDMPTRQKLYEIPYIYAGPWWSPDSTRFVLLTQPSPIADLIQIYEAQTGQLLLEFDAPFLGSSVAWSSDGSLLAVNDPTSVQIRDANTGQLIRSLDVRTGDPGLHFSPTNNLLALENLDGDETAFEIWDADTGEFVQQMKGHTDRILGLSWSSGGLVSTGFDSTIRIWDLETGRPTRSFQAGLYPRAQLSADGTILLVTDRDTGIHTRDAVTGQIIGVFGE